VSEAPHPVGGEFHFECKDIFQFAQNGKVKQVTIIYAIAKIRPVFEKIKK
jgi:hypothetical protein